MCACKAKKVDTCGEFGCLGIYAKKVSASEECTIYHANLGGFIMLMKAEGLGLDIVVVQKLGAMPCILSQNTVYVPQDIYCSICDVL